MKFHKYLSLNIFSLIGLLCLVMFITIYSTTAYFPFIYEKCNSLYNLFDYYIYALFLNIFCIILFIPEFFIRKKHPNFLCKIYFKNKFLKNLHETLFITGSWFAAFNLILFIVFVISIGI